ncbi:PhzF family phenazine biosynthesis protein [Alphaproteobacteria bacterium]|jgi:PhzF family phenazine biosynthesis protein|nr:PhzF family phenazine biosynthesis protein [Alphaproteobacteria bacterium]
MKIQRLSAFSDGNQGGNPAGVVIGDSLPDSETMQRVAAKVGFSETAFAAPVKDGWKVRYFSPETEVPFCGHATIALGAALALENGDEIFSLELSEANITVEGKKEGAIVSAALQSPPTKSFAVSDELKAEALALFGYTETDLDARIPIAHANAGADFLVIALNSREKLKAMTYELEEGKAFMHRNGFITVCIVFAETDQFFHTRNPFASGGVYEDPATGAATAAFCGYLRDINWPHGGEISIVQGEDMGMRSLIGAKIAAEPGSSIRVSGTARTMND